MATRKTTTAKSTTTRKTPAKRSTAPKAATAKSQAPKTAQAAAPKTTVVSTVKPVVSENPIKKPELIDRVVAQSGMKKKDVKPVVEAMLAVLGQSLLKGEALVLPPLGKVMVKNTKDLANASVMNVKVRQPKSMQIAPKEGVAAVAE